MSHVKIRKWNVQLSSILELIILRCTGPGGYLQWQDTDLNDIWCTPPSPTLDLAIENINVERLARGLSLWSAGFPLSFLPPNVMSRCNDSA